MARKLCLIVGIVLVLVAVIGFLASSVMLASAADVRDVRPPPGAELQLPADDPVVKQRRDQAESVLLGSLLVGALGVVVLIVGWRLQKTSRTGSIR